MDKLANPIAAHIAPRAHLIALALFAIAAAAVLDDYGVDMDEAVQRRIGYASFGYIGGSQDALTEVSRPSDQYYGVAFELALVAAERLLGLEDSRSVHLSRRLIAHAFFLIGGFFAWLLAYRLFGNRIIALFAMLVFLLHPRIYAHSFFNTKDLPFLGMFMVSLYLIHRAFRRDSVWAFALCGMGVALLANIRIIGLMLIPAVLGMLALDGFRAATGGEGRGIRRALANSGAFIASFAAALYAGWPLLWRDPSELAEAVRVMSRHPTIHAGLFRGELVAWPNIPWDYIPTWILITAPPAAPLLAALGIAAVARLCAADWRGMFANTTARFGMLTVACLVLPVATVIALNSNLYSGWRQMYFLWAPLCVLAAFGFRFAAAAFPTRRRLRAAALAVAALGIALAAVQMVRLHPYQHEYFNFLVNKTGVSERWTMDYFDLSLRAAFERMLALQPAGRFSVNSCELNERSYKGINLRTNFTFMPPEDRSRIHIKAFPPDFCLARGAVADAAWTVDIYGETMLSLMDRRDAARAVYADAYAAAKSAKPDFEAHFNVYAADRMVIYLREPCADGDELGTFTASARPVHPNPTRRLYMPADGFANKTFQFRDYGERVGGACVMALKTPDYPLESMRVGYRPPGSERDLWSADIPVNNHIAAHETAMGAVPLARSGYDIYADGGRLIYVKRQCAGDDIRARFFLFIYPEGPADPSRTRADSSERRSSSFDFHRRGAEFDGKCVVVRDLPYYPINRIETGQWLPSESPNALWRADFAPPGFYERRLRLAESSGEPAIRADFEVHWEGDSLLYIRKDCAASDTRGRFWLSVFPENPADLPQERRDAGFEHESLNFDFHRHGAVFDGKCVSVRELPDYPIAAVETGQTIPGEGELWRGRIAGD